MVMSFWLSFFPRGALDELLNLIESVSEGFPYYFYRKKKKTKEKNKQKKKHPFITRRIARPSLHDSKSSQSVGALPHDNHDLLRL